MRSMMRTMFFIFLTLGVFSPAIAGPEISDAKLNENFQKLSSSPLVGGDGWRVYDKLLHKNYSRWAMGEIYEGRQKFVKSLEVWWDAGMRVSSRDVELVAVDITENLAIIRFKTVEAFVSPDGPSPGFSGYVSNIWIKECDEWKLLSAEIYSTQREDVKQVQVVK